MGDRQFWLGLLLGGILSVPTGIISILLARHVTAYLERRKLIKTRKTREQALEAFRRVKAFRNGTKDRYPFYMLLTGSSVLAALTACTVVIAVLLIEPNFENAVVWFAISAILVILSVVLLALIGMTARALERFDDYKKEFEERWGRIDDPN